MQRWLAFPLVLCLFAATALHAQDAEEKSKPRMQPVTEELKQLVADGERLYEAARGTAAQEPTNFWNNRSVQHAVKVIRKGEPFRKGSLNWGLKLLRGVVERGKLADEWPEMPKVDVPRASLPLTIDGKLDELDWQQAATFSEIYPFNEMAAKGPKTTWKILWDNEYLYFAFDCADVDLVAPEMERDEAVYSADCVEMFILPRKRTRTYWELVISPSGGVFDAIHCKHVDQWGAAADASQTMEGLRFAFSLRGTLNQPDDKDEGYTAEIAVPFDQLPEYAHAKPAAGQSLRMMLVRLDKNGDKMTPYAFQPLLGWGHNIWNHAHFTLR